MNPRGFSLTEVLLVMVILTLVGALVTPMVTAARTGLADTTARLLWSDLEHTQVLAIARPDTRIGLQIDQDGGGWRIIDVDHPDTPLTDALDDGALSRTLAVRLGEQRAAACEHVTIAPGGRLILFDPLGGLNTPGGPDQSLTISGPMADRIVTIDSDTGFVSVQTP